MPFFLPAVHGKQASTITEGPLERDFSVLGPLTSQHSHGSREDSKTELLRELQSGHLECKTIQGPRYADRIGRKEDPTVDKDPHANERRQTEHVL